MKTSLKEVKIIARYIHKTNGKANGRVSYLIRSSNGKDIYCTTLINAEASGCSCPSRKPCYHMVQLTQRETARKALAPKVAKPVATTKQPISKPDMMNAALTRQGFSLMR